MKSGDQLNVPVPLPLFVKVAPVGRLEADSTGIVASGSVAEMPKFRLAPSETDWAAMVPRRVRSPDRKTPVENRLNQMHGLVQSFAASATSTVVAAPHNDHR